MNLRSAVCAVCCIAFGAAFVAAGPIRDWVNAKRPGILFPKPDHYAPFPCPTPGQCPTCPVCPAQPGLAPVAPPQCPGGVCPLPRPVPTFQILPVGAPVVSAAPVP